MAVFPYADADQAGNTLYAFAQPHGLSTYANLSLAVFQTYSVGQYANYVITMTEGAPGQWTGTWPSWFTTGTYYMTVRRRAGGSPATSDLVVGAGDVAFSGSSPPSPGTVPTPAYTFQPPTPSASSLAALPFRVNVGESRWVAFNFGTQPEVLAGSVVSNVAVSVSPDNGGLTIDDTTNDDTRGLAFLTAETEASYTLTFTAALDDEAGTVIVRDGVGTVTVE